MSQPLAPPEALLVSARYPLGDTGPAAAVLAPALGAHPSDVAAALRRSPGFIAVALDVAAAEAAAAALRAAGQPFFVAAGNLVPRPPKPLVASSLDCRDADALRAQVRLTGPAEVVPYRSVLAAVPARWISAAPKAVAAAPKGRSMASVAMSLATSGGVGLLLPSKPGKGGKGDAEPETAVGGDSRALLALVTLVGPGQLGRLHVFADRCDYRVLAAPQPDVERNWRSLLAMLATRLRPDQPGALLMAEAIAGSAAALVADDDNFLADRLRWLMLCATLRRLGVMPALG